MQAGNIFGSSAPVAPEIQVRMTEETQRGRFFYLHTHRTILIGYLDKNLMRFLWQKCCLIINGNPDKNVHIVLLECSQCQTPDS